MRRKIEPEQEIELPAGLRTLGTQQLDLWPKQPDVSEPMAKDKRRKVYPYWIVLLERSGPKPAGLVPTIEVIHTWRFAWTRKWALDLARQAQAEGWTVVDIVAGSKNHIIHKYTGL